MINITNIGIINDGTLKRLSCTWEELDAEGKTVSTNNHMSRVVTDESVLEAISTIEAFVTEIIEEG